MNIATMQNLTDEELIFYSKQKCCELCQGLLIVELANRLERATEMTDEQSQEFTHVRQ